MTFELADLTLKQLLETERSHIFEVRVRQSEILRAAGNKRYSDKPEPQSSSSSKNSTQDSHIALAEAVELYQRALYHVDFEESAFQFEFNETHRSLARRARAPLFLNLARCSLRLGNLRDALRHALLAVKAIEGETDDTLLHSTRTKANLLAARAYIKLREFGEAEAILNATLDTNPDNAEAFEMLGNVMVGLSEDKKKERISWRGKLSGKPKLEPNIMARTMNSSGGSKLSFMSFWRDPEILTSVGFIIFFAVILIFVVLRLVERVA